MTRQQNHRHSDTAHEARTGQTNEGKSSSGLIEDGAALAPGQMYKSSFLLGLRGALETMIDEELAGTPYSSRNCPWLHHYFVRYQVQSVDRLGEVLERFVGGPPRKDPMALQAAVVARARMGVARWRDSGQSARMPPGVPPAEAWSMPEMPRAGAELHDSQAADTRLPPGLTGSGRALDPGVAARMGAVFGSNFSDVSIHSDAEAHHLVSSAGARALAMGTHIAFRAGEYQPGTLAGDALIAHELAHVAQQRGADDRSLPATPARADGAAERDADASTFRAVTALWSRPLGLSPTRTSPTETAAPRMRTGLKLQGCTSTPPDKEILDFTVDEPPGGMFIQDDASSGAHVVVGTRHHYRLAQGTFPTALGASGQQVFPYVHRWAYGPVAQGSDSDLQVVSAKRNLDFVFTHAGTWAIRAEVRITSRQKIIIQRLVTARTPGEHATAHLDELEKSDFLRFRLGLAHRDLELAHGTVEEQPGPPGQSYISTTGSNPAKATYGYQSYAMHPSASAKKFDWYVVAAGTDKDSVIPVSGPSRGLRPVLKDGAYVYRPSTRSGGKVASWIMSTPGTYWLVCDELDDNGQPLRRSAVYKQVVLSSDDHRALSKWREHTKKVDDKMATLEEASHFALPALLMLGQSGADYPLSLFVGKDRKSGRITLFDLTPDAPKTTYRGATVEDAITSFRKHNKYPAGLVTYRVPANSLGGSPGQKTFEITRDESWTSKLSSASGWASLGLSAAGFVALFTPLAELSPMLFSAGAALGATSAGLSLVSRFQSDRTDARGVAIDILGLAASLLGLKTSLAARNSVIQGSRRYLIYTQFAVEGAEATLIAWEAVDAINDILNRSELSQGERVDQLVRLLGQLAVTGGLLVHSARGMRGQTEPPQPLLADPYHGPGRSMDELIDQESVPFSTANTIPGGAEGARRWGQSGRYIRTQQITPQDLNYEYGSALRPAYTRNPVLAKPHELPDAPVKKISNTVMASDDHSGSAGLVRLAELDNGRPVIVKSYPPRGTDPTSMDQAIREEAANAQFMDELGIGPRFHGVTRDADGRLSLVTDVVPGDSVGTPVTRETLSDLETMLSRMKDAGFHELGDFQYLRTHEGRLLVIDPPSVSRFTGQTPWFPYDSVGGLFTRERRWLLYESPIDVATKHLEELKRSNRKAWEGLHERVKQDLRGSTQDRTNAARYLPLFR